MEEIFKDLEFDSDEIMEDMEVSFDKEGYNKSLGGDLYRVSVELPEVLIDLLMVK